MIDMVDIDGWFMTKSGDIRPAFARLYERCDAQSRDGNDREGLAAIAPGRMDQYKEIMERCASPRAISTSTFRSSCRLWDRQTAMHHRDPLAPNADKSMSPIYQSRPGGVITPRSSSSNHRSGGTGSDDPNWAEPSQPASHRRSGGIAAPLPSLLLR